MRRIRLSSNLGFFRRFGSRVAGNALRASVFGAVVGTFAFATASLDARSTRFVPQKSDSAPTRPFATPSNASPSSAAPTSNALVAQNYAAQTRVAANRSVPSTSTATTKPATTPANPNDAKWPVGMFAETKYDYKGIPRGTNARHTFAFVNNSSKPVRLAYVRSSCGCTRVYAPTNKVYRPGERGEIIAEIDAVRYTGVRHATLTAVFDSPRRAEVSLDVRGLVVENVRLTPTVMKFTVDEADANDERDDSNASKAVGAAGSSATKAVDASKAQTATILYPSFNETIVKAESSNPNIRVQIGKPTRTNAGLQTPLSVSVAADAPAGYFSDVVYLWSNGANAATPMTLNVEGVVRPRVTVSPRTLSFEAFDDNKVVKNVVVAGSRPFAVKKVESDSPALECDLAGAGADSNDARPRSAQILSVAFDPKKIAERTTSRLTIETSDGRVLTVEANLSAEGAEVRRANASAKPKTTTNEKAALQDADSTKRR